MSRTPRIGILTGGGDVPGLNAVIKSVVYRATELGYEVYGIRRGWEGLTHMKPGPELDSDYIIPLDRTNTRSIDRTGGTWLHTSRTNARKMKAGNLPAHIGPDRLKQLETKDGVYNFTPVVLENIEKLGLDYLVPIGGDDTLSFSQVLADKGVKLDRRAQDHGQRRPGHRVLHRLLHCHQPGQGRDQPPADHPRLARADRRLPDLRPRRRFHRPLHGLRDQRRCLIPEYEFDLDHLVELARRGQEEQPQQVRLRIAAEGAIWKGGELPEYGPADAFGHKHKANIAEVLASEIQADPARRRSPAS
jgi:6-phosphofructokinase